MVIWREGEEIHFDEYDSLTAARMFIRSRNGILVEIDGNYEVER